MADRDYRILVAKDRDGIAALAVPDWTVLESTVREFNSLDTHHDLFFGDLGRVVVDRSGVVALAYKKV
jgi:hypothetical protein